MKWFLGILLLVVLATVMLVTVRSRPHDAEAEFVTGGNVDRGRVAIRQYACPTCHVIPGIAGAESLVGPPLNGIARRRYLGGALPNTPGNLVRWVRTPQAYEPGSAMPDLGVTDAHARDIAAYLYTLR